MHDDDNLGHEMRRILDPVTGEPNLGAVSRRGKVLQTRRILGQVAAIGIVVLAVAWPLRSLVDLGPPDQRTGADPDVASLLTLTCNGESTVLTNRVVRAQLEGVRIAVDNLSGREIGLVINGVSGRNIPTGNSSLVYPLAPGEARIACTPVGFVDTESIPFVTLEVLPAGGWVSPDIECEKGHGVGFEGLPVPVRDPAALVDAVRARATGVPPGARVERAGYAAVDSAAVRVVYDGVVIASFSFKKSSEVGWELWDITFCEGQRIGWQSG